MRLPLLLLFLLLFLLGAATAGAQTYRLHGKVTNDRLEPLALATVEVRGSKQGTTSREDGTYSLTLEGDTYEIVVSMIGYQPQVIKVALFRDLEQNILLQPDAGRQLGTIVVRGRYRDRAEEVVRQAVRRKEALSGRPGPHAFHVYIKAFSQDSLSRPKEPDTATTRKPAALAEIWMKVEHSGDGRVKEQRLGVRQQGEACDLFYRSTLEGAFDLHQNLLQLPALSPTPLLSPLSWSGLAAYRFRTVRIEPEGAHKLYVISVRPGQLSNATVEGELRISDSGWVLRSARFALPRYHLARYDAFEVSQWYGTVEDSAWMLQRQEFVYRAGGGKRLRSGTTLAVYDSFRLRQTFPKRHFGMELSATLDTAYKRDSSFWQTVRPAPLTDEEVRFVRHRDSLYRITQTKGYQDSVDRVINRVTWKKVSFAGQTLYNREKERTWHLPPVASLYQPLQFGGARINPSFFYSKRQPDRRFVSLHTQLSWGIRNKDLNGSIRLNRLYNPFNRGFYSISLGRDFQYIFQGDAWINMLKRSNIFLAQTLGAGHGIELRNGLFLYSNVDMSFRRSVSDYRTGTLTDSLLGDLLTDNQAVAFASYNALYGRIRLSYTPFMRYVREPLEKIHLGSSWPTFSVTYRKGIPGPLGSQVDFDYLEFGVNQELKLGLAGITQYEVRSGAFLSRRDLRLVDYQFQRRGDPWLMLNPQQAFQALDSTFPLFRRFYQAHLVHEFNGFLLNRIPLFKKLGLREMAGAGWLIAPERDLRYGELFAGVERVFKWPFNPLSKFKLGAYVVGSAANQFSNLVRFKVGFTTWNKEEGRWR